MKKCSDLKHGLTLELPTHRLRIEIFTLQEVERSARLRNLWSLFYVYFNCAYIFESFCTPYDTDLLNQWAVWCWLCLIDSPTAILWKIKCYLSVLCNGIAMLIATLKQISTIIYIAVSTYRSYCETALLLTVHAWAEWCMQFQDEIAPLAALQITCHYCWTETKKGWVIHESWIQAAGVRVECATHRPAAHKPATLWRLLKTKCIINRNGSKNPRFSE